MATSKKTLVLDPKQGDTLCIRLRVVDKCTPEAIQAQYDLDRLLADPETDAVDLAAAIEALELASILDVSAYTITSQVRLTKDLFWNLAVDMTDATEGCIALTAEPEVTATWKPVQHFCDVQFIDPVTGHVASTQNFKLDVQKDTTYNGM